MTSKYKFSAICILLIMTMLSSFLILPVSAATEAEAKALAKIDPVLLEKMETASPDEKIPVAIWYTDIDQEKVDKLTVDKVGYTQDDIALTYEMPSTELINNLKKGEEDAVSEMQAYLKRTEKVRENERKRTNEYIMTRREFSRVKYNEKSAKIIKDISLEEKDITFKSQYAPMITATLTIEEIENHSKNVNITNIYYEYPENLSIVDDNILDHVGDAKKTIRYDEVLGKLSSIENTLDGSGVIIGVSEPGGKLESHSELNNASIIPMPGISYNENNTGHATRVTRLIVGENSGFAKGVTIVSANTSKSMIEEMLKPSYNVNIINASYSIGSYGYGSDCKWYDHIISQHSVTIVASACNNDEGYRLYAPGLCYNTIMVGAYYLGTDSNNNVIYNDELSDDKVTSATGYLNSECAEKPDVMMPGTATSHATPILTSCIALALQLKPSLASYPQVIKAIVLASCHRKVLPARAGEEESIYSGITEHQGAGAPDIFNMLCIVCQGTYGVGRISSAKNQAVRRFVMPSYNSSSMNVSLTWIKENTIKSGTSHTVEGNAVAGADVNLDLSVYRNDGKSWDSNLSNSSTEMVYFDLNNSYKNYEIRISDVGAYEGVIRYGYAYSTNDSYVTPATEEGIYYIRNYYSDKYLTLNTSTNETVMSNFTGANNQQWVLRGTTGDYEIYPAHYSASQKINFGSQVGSNPYYKSVLGTSDLNLSMKSWETDTTLEPDAYVFTSTSGGSNNIMSYTSSTGVFVRSATESVINMYRMWVLEDINYKNGDMNVDGDIDVTDATIIEKYLANTITLSNAQQLLGDANYDGRISIQDATYVRKLAANII